MAEGAFPGAAPKELAIPAGFGTGAAGPSSKQQTTSWSSDLATIEQRWPADADRIPESTGTDQADSFTAVSDRAIKPEGSPIPPVTAPQVGRCSASPATARQAGAEPSLFLWS